MGLLHGANSLPNTRYLFIDGGSFRATMERFHKTFFPEADRPRVNYSRVGNGFTKIFYYDCPPPQGSQDTKAIYEQKLQDYEEAMQQLRSLDGWHVFEGVMKRKGRKATQKEVDVLIAVDMLTHTYRRNMHRLSFITGDQDFRPLIEAIVREGMFVEIRYDPASTSIELLNAADSRKPFIPNTLFNYLDEAFKKAHPMPSQSLAAKSGGKIICRGKNKKLDHIEFIEEEGSFLFRYPDLINNGRLIDMKHSDRAFLTLVFEHTYGPIEWNNGGH